MLLLQQLAEQNLPGGFEFLNKLPPKFFIRLGINLLAMFILIRLIYFRYHKKKEFTFTFFIFNLIIFLITFLLNKVEMSLGAAFGLFAVFSMLRYRTEGITMKDMTYLFLSIAIGLITAIIKGGWDELLLINFIILAFTFVLESNFFIRQEYSKIIHYEKIELMPLEKRAELIADLQKRTGLKIHRISITRIDFLRDSVLMTVYYHL